jgi:cytochrome c biogenesis protein CcmG/thiol:disulfide interchange protein DsbE
MPVMSTRRLLFFVPVLLFAGLVAYLAYALRVERDPSAVPSAMIDKPVPQFDLPPLLAELPGVASGDLAVPDPGGKPVLVNFFASWCVPCRAEHPLLMRLAEEKRITLYGIAYKDKPEDAKAFLAELGNPFSRVGVDASGRTAIDFGVYGVPESYLVDAKGRIRFRQVGPLYDYVLDKQLQPLLDHLAAQ